MKQTSQISIKLCNNFLKLQHLYRGTFKHGIEFDGGAFTDGTGLHSSKTAIGLRIDETLIWY